MNHTFTDGQFSANGPYQYKYVNTLPPLYAPSASDGFTYEWRARFNELSTTTGTQPGQTWGCQAYEAQSADVSFLSGYYSADPWSADPNNWIDQIEYNSSLDPSTTARAVLPFSIYDWRVYRITVLGEDPCEAGVVKANFYQDGVLVLEEFPVGLTAAPGAPDYFIAWYGVAWYQDIGAVDVDFDYARLDVAGAWAPVPEKCGDAGADPNASDINEDCITNLKDFAIVGDGWMRCSNPADAGCEELPWIYEDFSATAWNPAEANFVNMADGTNDWEVSSSGAWAPIVYSESYNPTISAALRGQASDTGSSTIARDFNQVAGKVSFTYSTGYSPDYGGKVILHNKDYTSDMLTLNFGTAWSGSAFRAFVRSGSTDVELPSDLISNGTGFVDVSFNFDAAGISNIDIRSDIQPWNHADVTSIAYGALPPGGVQQVKFVGGAAKDPFTPADPNYYTGYTQFSRQDGIGIDNIKSACGDFGQVYFSGDIAPVGSPDCYVDIDDLDVVVSEWLLDTAPEPYVTPPLPIMAHGSVTVDGDLTEWAGADWQDVDKFYYMHPQDINSGQMAVKWNSTTGKLYMAVVIEDMNHWFVDGYTNWSFGVSDRLEIFCKGDTNDANEIAGFEGSYGSHYSVRGQFYVVGPNSTGSPDTWGGGLWNAWGINQNHIPSGSCPTEIFEPATGFESAVAVSGDNIIYEIGVTPYDIFKDRHTGIIGTTVQTPLYAGKIVALDMVADTRWGPDPNAQEGHFGSKVGVDSAGVKAALTTEWQRYELGN